MTNTATTFVHFSRDFIVSFLEQETYLSIKDSFLKDKNSEIAFAFIQGGLKPYCEQTDDEIINELERYCIEQLNSDITIAKRFRKPNDSDFDILDAKTYTELHCELFKKIKKDTI